MNIAMHKWLIGLAALIALAAVWLASAPGGVFILAYHMVNDSDERYAISPVDFEGQMRYLAESNYQAISLAEMTDAFAGKKALPPKPVVITFDDGYLDNLEQALPIMERYGMKGTVFVLSGRMGQEGYLSWQQVRDLAARGTEIGSHTVQHMALKELDAEQREREVAQSKLIIESETGQSVWFLAYPYGSFDEGVLGLLCDAGYRGACTGIAGMNNSATNPYLLHRVNIPQPRYGLWEFRARLLKSYLVSTLCHLKALIT